MEYLNSLLRMKLFYKVKEKSKLSKDYSIDLPIGITQNGLVPIIDIIDSKKLGR